MPSDQFYGGTGVDILYPNTMMSNPFSEPEWSSSHIAPLPNSLDFDATYPVPASRGAPPPIEVSPIPPHMLNIPRPKSSPSTFGPNVEDLLFPENPFRSRGEEYPSFSFPMSPQQSSAKPYYGHDYHHAHTARSSPNRQTGPVPIAPDPIGLRQLNALKRIHPEEEYVEYGQRKRKRAPSNAGPVELNEEEQLLLKLKEEENLPWKDIAVRFQTDLGKSYQVPALQMRFKRLRERMRSWTETDVQALNEAYDYWEKFQFDIIAAKMLDFGASERWPAKYCARKWEELHPGRVPFQSTTGFLQDPWASEHCSPVDSHVSQISHSPRPSMGGHSSRRPSTTVGHSPMLGGHSPMLGAHSPMMGHSPRMGHSQRNSVAL